MLSFLRRRWFLLVLIFGISAAILQTEAVGRVVSPIPPRAVVAVTLFVMSWGLERRQLWSAVVRPWPALWALAISYGLLPALGWLFSYSFVTRDYGIGLLIITSVPCTLASAAIWTRLAGGNEAIALLVTMLTTFTSWLVTTGWLTLTTGAAVHIDVVRMMLDLVLFLVAPVALGQLARWPPQLRQIATRGKIAMGVVSRLLIFVMILQAVVKAAGSLGPLAGGSQYLSLAGVAAICLSVHLAGLIFGFFSGRLLRFDRGSRIAIAFSGSQKTLPVSLLLAEAYYSQPPNDFPLAVVPILFFHVGQLVVDTFIVDLLNPSASPKEGAESV